jgi:hypothetical protein
LLLQPEFTYLERLSTESSVDDLGTCRGVVLRRAASILRSIETQPLTGRFVRTRVSDNLPLSSIRPGNFYGLQSLWCAKHCLVMCVHRAQLIGQSGCTPKQTASRKNYHIFASLDSSQTDSEQRPAHQVFVRSKTQTIISPLLTISDKQHSLVFLIVGLGCVRYSPVSHNYSRHFFRGP